MSGFTGPLTITEIVPGKRWRLVEPIRFEVDYKGSGRVIVVPAGFETDGASIPALLRTVLAVWGTYGRAATLHDYLYSIIRNQDLFFIPEGMALAGIEAAHPAFAVFHSFNGRLGWYEAELEARRCADHAFYDAMRACGTAKWLAKIMFWSVRIFGEAAILKGPDHAE